MLHFKVIGMNLATNELALRFHGRVIYFKPEKPVFYFRLGQMIHVQAKNQTATI